MRRPEPVVDDHVTGDRHDARRPHLRRKSVEACQRILRGQGGARNGVRVVVVEVREIDRSVRLGATSEGEVTLADQHEIAVHGAVDDLAGALDRRDDRRVRTELLPRGAHAVGLHDRTRLEQDFVVERDERLPAVQVRHRDRPLAEGVGRLVDHVQRGRVEARHGCHGCRGARRRRRGRCARRGGTDRRGRAGRRVGTSPGGGTGRRGGTGVVAAARTGGGAKERPGEEGEATPTPRAWAHRNDGSPPRRAATGSCELGLASGRAVDATDAGDHPGAELAAEPRVGLGDRGQCPLDRLVHRHPRPLSGIDERAASSAQARSPAPAPRGSDRARAGRGPPARGQRTARRRRARPAAPRSTPVCGLGSTVQQRVAPRGRRRPRRTTGQLDGGDLDVRLIEEVVQVLHADAVRHGRHPLAASHHPDPTVAPAGDAVGWRPDRRSHSSARTCHAEPPRRLDGSPSRSAARSVPRHPRGRGGRGRRPAQRARWRAMAHRHGQLGNDGPLEVVDGAIEVAHRRPRQARAGGGPTRSRRRRCRPSRAARRTAPAARSPRRPRPHPPGVCRLADGEHRRRPAARSSAGAEPVGAQAGQCGAGGELVAGGPGQARHGRRRRRAAARRLDVVESTSSLEQRQQLLAASLQPPDGHELGAVPAEGIGVADIDTHSNARRRRDRSASSNRPSRIASMTSIAATQIGQRIASAGRPAVAQLGQRSAWPPVAGQQQVDRAPRRDPISPSSGRPVAGETVISSSASAAPRRGVVGSEQAVMGHRQGFGRAPSGHAGSRARSSSEHVGAVIAGQVRLLGGQPHAQPPREGVAVRIEPGQRPPLQSVDTGVVEGRAVLVDPDPSRARAAAVASAASRRRRSRPRPPPARTAPEPRQATLLEQSPPVVLAAREVEHDSSRQTHENADRSFVCVSEDVRPSGVCPHTDRRQLLQHGGPTIVQMMTTEPSSWLVAADYDVDAFRQLVSPHHRPLAGAARDDGRAQPPDLRRRVAPRDQPRSGAPPGPARRVRLGDRQRSRCAGDHGRAQPGGEPARRRDRGLPDDHRRAARRRARRRRSLCQAGLQRPRVELPREARRPRP